MFILFFQSQVNNTQVLSKSTSNKRQPKHQNVNDYYDTFYMKNNNGYLLIHRVEHILT